ncbi:MAG: 50S ribosomal protein L6 [Beijerinckiaceae bacterium]
MSRLGKKAVEIPNGCQVRLDGSAIVAKGPKGELRFSGSDDVEVKIEGNLISFSPRNESKRARAMWGTTRAQVQNIVTGSTLGFQKKLEITGVGYKAAVAGKNLQLSLGYSHEINVAIPDDITIVTPKPVEIVISGNDRQRVGQIAAEIRAYRGPEPYKGKGVKYEGEFIFRKEGKKK